MKKLNQKEIQLLAKRIISDLSKQAEEVQAALDKESDANNRPLAKKLIGDIRAYNKAMRSVIAATPKTVFDIVGKPNNSFIFVPKLDEVVKKMRVQQTKIDVPTAYYYHMIDNCKVCEELMLKQIECDDVALLIKLVTKSFIKPGV